MSVTGPDSEPGMRRGSDDRIGIFIDIEGTTATVEAMSALFALHRYWIWANRLRDHFDAALARGKAPTSDAEMAAWLADDMGMLMSHWYAALYVVVEGYRKVGVNDPILDDLLKSPNVELLRRYRNGVCHFQRDYFDGRFSDFMGVQDTPRWVRTLNREFGRMFLQRLGADMG